MTATSPVPPFAWVRHRNGKSVRVQTDGCQDVALFLQAVQGLYPQTLAKVNNEDLYLHKDPESDYYPDYTSLTSIFEAHNPPGLTSAYPLIVKAAQDG